MGGADWRSSGHRYVGRMAVAARTFSSAATRKAVMAALSGPTRERMTLDLSALPSVAFGHRNTTWLANVLYMTIEGTMFAMVFATYFYLRTRSSNWPPGHYPPALTFGMTNAAIFIVSLIPARWVQKRAPSGDRSAIRNGLLILSLFALAATAIRVFEFTTLNCRWTDDAYSSAIWVLIGLHSGHLATELIETLVLLAVACTPKMEGTRLADAAINSDYWYFVVVTGLIIDFLIYGTTRFL